MYFLVALWPVVLNSSIVIDIVSFPVDLKVRDEPSKSSPSVDSKKALRIIFTISPNSLKGLWRALYLVMSDE